MRDYDEDFRDDYLWDVENGFIEEAKALVGEDEEEDDETILGLDSYEIAELEDAGIDIDEFEFMDDYEKREALIEAGLDPDDYEFF